MRQLWAASLDTERSIAAEWWYFWDELAAVIAIDPSVATISERLVAIDDLGVTVEREDGVPASVASAADRNDSNSSSSRPSPAASSRPCS